jgi:hypothetical protein
MALRAKIAVDFLPSSRQQILLATGLRTRIPHLRFRATHYKYSLHILSDRHIHGANPQENTVRLAIHLVSRGTAKLCPRQTTATTIRHAPPQTRHALGHTRHLYLALTALWGARIPRIPHFHPLTRFLSLMNLMKTMIPQHPLLYTQRVPATSQMMDDGTNVPIVTGDSIAQVASEYISIRTPVPVVRLGFICGHWYGLTRIYSLRLPVSWVWEGVQRQLEHAAPLPQASELNGCYQSRSTSLPVLFCHAP